MIDSSVVELGIHQVAAACPVSPFGAVNEYRRGGRARIDEQRHMAAADGIAVSVRYWRVMHS